MHSIANLPLATITTMLTTSEVTSLLASLAGFQAVTYLSDKIWALSPKKTG